MRQIFLHALAKSLVLVTFAAGLSGSNTAIVAAQDKAEPAFAHEASDLKPDPRVTYGVLENGLRYAVMKNATPKGVAAIRMRIATGSINETEEQRGLAHFLEHMAFNGSVNVPEGEMVKRLERYGLAFGADTNASTGFDQTTYKLNLPSVDDEVLDEAFFLMRETASNLLLAEDAIERERGVIASEKSARDSIEFRARIDRLGFLTQGSGLIERLPIGIDETIATMPREQFVAYYRGYYRPENTFITVIGDLDTDEAISRIKQFFGDWQPKSEALPHRLLAPTKVPAGAVRAYHSDGLMTSVTLAALKPYEKRPDTIATRRENVIRSLGTRIFNRRFERAVRNGTATYLGASSGQYRVYETVDGMIVSLRSSPQDWRDALAEAEQELRRAIEFGFTRKELDEEMAVVRQAQETAVERANTRKTYAQTEYNYAKAIVDAFAGERVFTSPQSSLERINALADDLSVEDVNAAFREAWAGYENPAIYYVSSEPLDDPEVALRETLKASQKVAVSAPEQREAKAFAYTDFGPAGAVVAEEYVEDADAYLIRFSNNVRLNFKQTSFDTGSINIRVRAGHGFMSMPERSEGLRRLGLNVLNASGVKGHTEDDIASLFAGRRVYTTTRTRLDNDAFETLGSTDTDDLEAQLNLMAAKVSAPAFREEIAQQHFRKMRAWYPTHDASPKGVADKYIARLIRSGDTRYGYDDLESFLSPTMAQVREWIEPELSTGPIEITVVGDVDKDTLVAQIARTFGALPARGERITDFGERARLQFPSATQQPERFYHKGSDEQALVYVYWPAPDASDPSDAYRMRVLRSVFRNRLTDELREAMGATYSPGVGAFSNRLFKGYGYLLARVTAKPEDVDAVRTGTLRVARQMVEAGVEQDEFERALKPLIEDLDSTLENNGYWLSVLGDAQSGAHGLHRFRAQAPTYDAMNLQDIRTLAARIFGDSEQSVSYFVLPAQGEDTTPMRAAKSHHVPRNGQQTRPQIAKW